MDPMSQPAANPHTERSVRGMVASMIVVVLVVVGWVGFRALNDNQPSIITATVPQSAWEPYVTAGRNGHSLLLYAPTKLPHGWRATSVNYTGGPDPVWHLGVLTDKGKYVGIEESKEIVSDMLSQFLSRAGAQQGKDVVLGSQTWQTWTAGADYALTRTLTQGGYPLDTVLVVGSAPRAEIRAYAGALTVGTIKQAS
jgi:hypothetical protein